MGGALFQVAVARHQAEETLKAINKKFWIPEEWTMSKLEKRIRFVYNNTYTCGLHNIQ